MNRSGTRFALATAVTLLGLLLAACVDKGLPAVFFTLENERELVDDRGMSDEASVFRMVETGPLSTDEYFAAAGSVYWREKAAGSWQKIAPPVAGALCNAIEYFGTQIVAWFFAASDGSAVGLYTMDPKNTAAGWTAVTTADVTPTGLSLLKVAGGQLFIAHEHGGGYRLYAAGGFPYGAADIVAFPGPVNDVAVAIRDVAYDTNITAYWVATLPDAANSDKYLFTGSAPGTLSDAASPPATTVGRPAGGLFFGSDSRLYLSTEDGTVFFYPAGGPWSTWSGADKIKVDNTTVRFTSFVEADPGYLFVGTRANGYYRFAPSAGSSYAPSDFTRQPSYNISDLYNGAVLSFLAVDDPVLPDDPDSLFACTYGRGLWRADYDPDGTEIWPWVQE